MPRARRQTPGDIVYHVLNRANGKQDIFRGVSDFNVFEKVVAEGLKKIPMRLAAYCLMSNHWHMLLWPYNDGDLSKFIHWVTMTHTQRWHAIHNTSGTGHLYQGRFKSFPVQNESYYLTALRYIESNPLRAGLVNRSLDWNWSSLAIRKGIAKDGIAISKGPVDLPDNWLDMVDILPGETDLKKIEHCINRGVPFGRQDWVEQTAKKLHLTSTVKPIGRPKSM
jgi:putative transposase